VHIVVTGGAGFIGSHLAERLVGAGHTVLLYDSFNKQYAPVIKRRNVAAALSLPGCSLIEGDVLESQRLPSTPSSISPPPSRRRDRTRRRRSSRPTWSARSSCSSAAAATA
jgi:NAD(P)-dependent dehydrogenase (short-subunit alcohol dehydrogenase family)